MTLGIDQLTQIDEVQLVDSNGNLGTIKPSSTASTSTDTAYVVALSPNSSVPSGSNTIGAINQGTSPWVTLDEADGPVSPGSVASKSILIGSQYSSSLPSLTTGQQSAIQSDSSGRLLIGSIASALPSGSNTLGAVTQASGPWTSNVTQFGSANVSTGTGASGSGIPRVTVSDDSKIIAWDGTNTTTVKAASTASVATDTALVVALSPNSAIPSGTNSIGTVKAQVQDNSGNGISSTNGGLNVTPVVGNTSGSVSGNGNLISVNGVGIYSGINLALFGTFSATINFFGSNDGTNYFAVSAISIATPASAPSSSWTATGLYYIPVTFTWFKVTVTNYASGTIEGIATYLDTAPTIQNLGSTTDFLVSGTITALNGNVSVYGQGVYTISASITGTWVATLIAEGQLADGTWTQLPMYQVNTTLPYNAVFSTASNGTFLITGGGYQNIRILASAFTSGTVDVALDGSLAQQTIFAAQLNSWNVGAQGIYNTTVPSLTNGQQNTVQLDSRAALIVTHIDGPRATYSGAVSFTPAATATDVFTITGSSTKTIRVTEIRITMSESLTAESQNVSLIKRSSANSGGTTASVTAVTHDSNNASATATVVNYTANATTLGTAVGTLRTERIEATTSGGAAVPALLWQFGNKPSQAIVLRGTSQILAVNFASTSPSTAQVAIEWTEE